MANAHIVEQQNMLRLWPGVVIVLLQWLGRFVDWGFSGSPWVMDDLVLVATSGALVAYDRATGDQRWSGPAGDTSYSSPQFLTIDGVAQVLQLNGDGAAAVSPAEGKTLWTHEWSGYPIVQPALTANGDVLLIRNAQEMASFRLALIQS